MTPGAIHPFGISLTHPAVTAVHRVRRDDASVDCRF
jgi:hypothetical protein